MSSWEDTTGVTDVYDDADKSSFERNRPCLVVLSGLHIGQTFTLDPTSTEIVGRSRSATIRLVDEGVSRHHARITPDSAGELWLEDASSRNGTFCNGKRIERHRLVDGDKLQLGRSTMLRFTYLDEHDESFQRIMYNSALRDGLTRTFNRRYFTDRLQAEFQFARRHNTHLALLLMDLDHFKNINDRYGHIAGDYVLTEFADAMQLNVRNDDILARFGGEEFAVVSRAVTTGDAMELAERLRRVIKSMRTAYEEHVITLTVSIGVACFPDIAARDPMELIDAADRALYKAKSMGRNRVVLFHEEDLAPEDDPSTTAEYPLLSK